MGFDELMGRYGRLKRELSAEYEARPWRAGRIDRLANELAATERLIAASGETRECLARHALPMILTPRRVPERPLPVA